MKQFRLLKLIQYKVYNVEQIHKVLPCIYYHISVGKLYVSSYSIQYKLFYTKLM